MALANYELLPAAVVVGLALTAFLVPHLLGVTIASDLVRDRADRRQARAVQAPLRVVIALSALAGTALRFSSA